MAMMKFREPNKVKWLGVRPAHNGTLIAKYKTASGGAAIVHTVSVGKTFYLCGMIFAYNASVAVPYGEAGVRDEGDAVQYELCVVAPDVAGQDAFSHSFWPPLELLAGWDVYIVTANVNMDVRVFIHGWEE